MRGIVIYDSLSGNTKKVAEAIAKEKNFELKKVDDAPQDLASYWLLVLGTPNIRTACSQKISDFLQKVNPPPEFALFITFGAPVWGRISSEICLNRMQKALKQKGSKLTGKFFCPGFHIKFKTYKGRPSEADLCRAREFAKLLNR